MKQPLRWKYENKSIYRCRACTEDKSDNYISPNNKYSIIADGMGGHNGGEVASQSAISLMSYYIDKQNPKNEKQVKEMLLNGITEVNNFIYEMSIKREHLQGMGTTLTICYIFRQTAIVAHVGDSRLYHITKDKIQQVTRDHSIVEQLIEQGA